MTRPGPTAFSVLVALAAALLAGCGTSAPMVTIASRASRQSYRQTFTQAYTARDAAGDYQVVLLHDPIDEVPADDAGIPLSPARVPALRQVLQVRVLWRPSQGSKADSPASTNAALHWYVLGGPTAGGTNIIHYAGTAFVAVVPNGPGAEVTIRNGSLKVVEHRGELIDPLKSFTLSGKFDALADEARVRQVLAEVKSVAAEAKAADTKPADSTPAEARAPAND